MDPTADKLNLPSVLTEIMQPWINVVEVADPGMGLNVMKVAAEVAMSLQRLVVINRNLEIVIADARLTSDNLGISLNQDGADPSRQRLEAMTALNGLVVQLRRATLNEEAKGLS